MKKNITLLISLLLMFYPEICRAETSDARAVGLGGTTIGSANGAFAPLRNPASITDLDSVFYILPFSATLELGNNFGNLSQFIPPNNSSDQKENQINYFSNIIDNLGKNNNKGRIEAFALVPVAGFSGLSFSKLKFADKPVSFGLNLWLKGNVTASPEFSDGLVDLMKNTPTLINYFEPFPQKIASISGWAANLSQSKFYFPDFNKYKDINYLNKDDIILKANSAISDIEKLQGQTLKPIIENSSLLLDSLDKLSNTLRNSLDLFDKFNRKRQTAKGQVVADGHAVIAFSAASRIYKNSNVDISFGLNLKGLFIPVNFNNDLLGNKSSQTLLPVVISSDLNLGPFKSIEDVKKIIDDQFNPVLEDAKNLLNTAKDVDRGLTYIFPKLKSNPISAAPDIPALEVDLTRLQNQFNDISKKASTDIANQTVEKIRKVVDKEIKDIKLDYSQITDVSPFGVGLDMGMQAKIGDELVLGFVLENPVLIWPSKLKKTQVSFDTNQLPLEAGKKFDLNKFVIYNESQKPEYTNYNLSEPFTIRLGGSYKLDKLFQTKDSIIFSDIEQVYNGRTAALHFGFEKGWSWNQGAIFARIGLQIGGLGNLITAGLGLKTGPFSIDLGYGSSSPLEPINSYTSVVALSTYLNF